jgi:hypothetical protein
MIIKHIACEISLKILVGIGGMIHILAVRIRTCWSLADSRMLFQFYGLNE